MWIQTGVTVRKRLSWVVTSVTLTFDLWPWPFAWTLLWSVVITPENFMTIRWWEHSQKGVTDRQTDGRTDRRTENTIHRAAWSQLKIQEVRPKAKCYKFWRWSAHIIMQNLKPFFPCILKSIVRNQNCHIFVNNNCPRIRKIWKWILLAIWMLSRPYVIQRQTVGGTSRLVDYIPRLWYRI